MNRRLSMHPEVAKPPSDAAGMELYRRWHQAPSPTTLTPLLEHLNPDIERALYTYGYGNDPNMRVAAQLHVAKALDAYDPARSGLSTYVGTALRRLQRIGPRMTRDIPGSERGVLDYKQVRSAEQTLRSDNNRDPTVDELSDATGLSAQRIARLRERYGLPTVSESSFVDEGGYVNMPGATTGGDMTPDNLWVSAVYYGVPPIDKKIIDWTYGWHGQPRYSKTEMARQLGISVAAITQRAKRLAVMLEDGLKYNVTT